MNFDPSQTPVNRIPDRQDEIIADREAASTASSTTAMIVSFIVTVLVVALVVAWSPWSTGGSSPSNVTPGQGGADTTPIPGQIAPIRPQLAPTIVP